MAIAFQDLYFSRILITALPYTSNPLAELSFPEKIINLSFLGNFFKGLIAGYKISQLFRCL